MMDHGGKADSEWQDDEDHDETDVFTWSCHVMITIPHQISDLSLLLGGLRDDGLPEHNHRHQQVRLFVHWQV